MLVIGFALESIRSHLRQRPTAPRLALSRGLAAAVVIALAVIGLHDTTTGDGPRGMLAEAQAAAWASADLDATVRYVSDSYDGGGLLIDEAGLELALAGQREHGGLLGQPLVSLGLATRDQILSAMAATGADATRRLGDVLIDSDVCDVADLPRALAAQRREGGLLGQHTVLLGSPIGGRSATPSRRRRV